MDATAKSLDKEGASGLLSVIGEEGLEELLAAANINGNTLRTLKHPLVEILDPLRLELRRFIMSDEPPMPTIGFHTSEEPGIVSLRKAVRAAIDELEEFAFGRFHHLQAQPDKVNATRILKELEEFNSYLGDGATRANDILMSYARELKGYIGELIHSLESSMVERMLQSEATQ